MIGTAMGSQRSATAGSITLVTSLRRHDPVQVQRV
jgi:hypothetical protein